MSVFNGASQLAQSIDSILSQSFVDFECVIIDDASTDGTPDILAAYAARDRRIRLLKNERNIGLTKSLNKAILASSGTYIARMDAGDLSESSRFEQQAAFLDAHPDYGLVGSWACVINEQGNPVGEMRYPTANEDLRRLLIRYNPFVHSSVMMRRSTLEAVGLYDESWRYAQDYELFFRLMRSAKGALIGEYLVSYRVYPQSITRRKNKLQIRYAIRARIKAIRSGQYPIWSYLFLVRPLLGYVLGYRLKELIKRVIA